MTGDAVVRKVGEGAHGMPLSSKFLKLVAKDPMRGARVDKADLLNVLMKTRLTLDVSLWDRTIGYYGGTA